ncbi:MAG: large conductance mechanosensitive channel protein MscL [Clostridiales bacterium]|nr:large conductance mechanosensitive channel protein MscL [Clostridiales bacterium]
MKKFFKEFKAFISKGNVFDMAVGLIIATAFNKIVSSMVNDLLMPLITYACGAKSLAELSVPLRYEWVDGVKNVTLSWKYGNFIQTIIDFLIIALSVFVMVKVVNTSREKLKELNEFLELQTKKEVKLEKKAVKLKAKEEGRKFKEVWAEHEDMKKKEAEEKAKILEEEKKQKELQDRLNNPTQEDLLKEIRDLLKEKNSK